jgi:hypothetical protein
MSFLLRPAESSQSLSPAKRVSQGKIQPRKEKKEENSHTNKHFVVKVVHHGVLQGDGACCFDGGPIHEEGLDVVWLLIMLLCKLDNCVAAVSEKCFKVDVEVFCLDTAHECILLSLLLLTVREWQAFLVTAHLLYRFAGVLRRKVGGIVCAVEVVVVEVLGEL